MEGTVENNKEKTELYTSKTLYITYVLLFIITIAIFASSIVLEAYDDCVLALLIMFILIDALFTEKRIVHIPPAMIIMLVIIMLLILIGRRYDDAYIISVPVNILFGVVLGLAGMIITYSLLKTMPNVKNERPFLTSFVSVSVGISMYLILNVISFYIHVIKNSSSPTLDDVMGQFTTVFIGTILVAVIFYLNKHNGLFKYTVNKYLESNVGTMGLEEYEIQEIKKSIKCGENEKVEYKSTLRTNLATGEKDPRIEKAVLKTLVAFLNTDGGTLLIGISDDGNVIGIDEDSFENRDKLNLHMTHLIANQIGNDFLHFISFRLVDFDGKGVMRVTCQKSNMPVFLIDGKNETFFVRSGPSSIDLNGTDLLNYAATRFKLSKRNNEKRFKF
ncbi:MAG: ATP-binding protein [Candidatus Methanogranum gryphiswaldense]|nr:MAG: ATP-binding protein [Candidatus Methanogranum sp. U3.2.1]